jgi:NADH:ubiquinone oxidoreductase subunit 6 (subunit J)
VHYRRTEDRFLLKIDHLYTKYDGLKDKLLPFVAIFIAPILGATILLNFFLGVISVPENSTGTGCHEFDIVGSSEGLAQIQNTLYDQQPLLLVSTALVLLVALIGAAVFLRRKKW